MPTGLTKDAGWQVGVSRTLPHSPSTVWDFLSGPDGLAIWLGPGADLVAERGAPYRTSTGAEGVVRSYRPGDRIRITYGPTTVQVAITPAGDGYRTVVRFHQERLGNAKEREKQRAHWQQVMEDIAAALDQR